MTIFQFKQQAIKELKASAINSVTLSPSLDVDIIISHFLKMTKTEILMNNKKELNDEQLEILNKALASRLTGLPIAYITNEKEFYGYSFYVNPDVLIPKPDTEILVEEAVNVILEKMDARGDSLLTVCDMCTGSGCIALSVFRSLIDQYDIPISQMPKFTLVDISSKALDIARKNAASLLSHEELSHISFIQSNLFHDVPFTFDVILTNPPYVPHSMVKELLQDGRSEPALALDGDITLSGDMANNDDGLEIIRNLIPQGYSQLTPSDGIMIMETGEYNAVEAAMIGHNNSFETDIIKDLEGQLRVVEFYK